MQGTKREHEIPGAMVCLILLFLLWKAHVVLSIFFQLRQAEPCFARHLPSFSFRTYPSSKPDQKQSCSEVCTGYYRRGDVTMKAQIRHVCHHAITMLEKVLYQLQVFPG